MAKGAVGQANISAKEMARIELPLPPIEFQRSFLDFAASVDKSRFARLRDPAESIPVCLNKYGIRDINSEHAINVLS